MAVSAVVAAGVVGAGATAYGASKSASATKSAANKASDTQLQMAAMAREDLAPWVGTGNNALGHIANLSGANGTEEMTRAQEAFQFSPGYQFRMDASQRALENSAAARGGLLSGSALMGLGQQAQGQAADEYSQYYNRLAGLAGAGQSAAAGQAGQSMQVGSNLASIYTQQGQQQAQAAQQMGANVNNLAGNALASYLYFNPQQPAAAAAPAGLHSGVTATPLPPVRSYG